MSNISYYGIKTIILHYLKIFFKEFYFNTISSLISGLIFIIILKTLSNYYEIKILNTNFMNFIVPGIVMMIIIQETFGNISGNIIWMKHHGTFNDLLLAPLSRTEIAVSFLISIWIIGLIIGFLNLLVINLFVEYSLFNIGRLIFYFSITSIFFASVGSIVGFISYTWETHQSFFLFLIIPISMLSGSFFPPDVLHERFQNFLLANPFYYLISNTRKSFINDGNYSIQNDFIIMILLFLIIYITLYIFKKGYTVIH